MWQLEQTQASIASTNIRLVIGEKKNERKRKRSFTISSPTQRGIFLQINGNQRKQLTTSKQPLKHKTITIHGLGSIAFIYAMLMGLAETQGECQINLHYSTIALGFQLWRLHTIHLVRRLNAAF